MSILERLFLVRRLSAWHRNQSKRLVKTPKVHVIDSGLATTLSGLKIDDWNNHKSNFGPVLESFIVQPLVCQASWIGSDFKFSHYRDKDQVEVDLVIERGQQLWGVEVKKQPVSTQKTVQVWPVWPLRQVSVFGVALYSIVAITPCH